MEQPNSSPISFCIHCLAHGGGFFFLRHDADFLKALIERGEPPKAIQILCRLASLMDIDVVERKVLTTLAGFRRGQRS